MINRTKIKELSGWSRGGFHRRIVRLIVRFHLVEDQARDLNKDISEVDRRTRNTVFCFVHSFLVWGPYRAFEF